MPNKLPVHIREMIRRDMPIVLEIEKGCFDIAWQEEDFIRHLRERNCIGMVAEAQCKHVVGYMIYELHSGWLRILNFAVHPDCRYHAVGRQMFEKLRTKLTNERRTHIKLEVRETNVDAQLFWKRLGFRCVKIMHGFYREHSDEDAYVFRYRYKGKVPAEDELEDARF